VIPGLAGAVAARTRSPWARRALIGVAILLALTAIIGVDYLPPRLVLVEGQPSPVDIEAPRSAEFVDQFRTAALRAEAVRAVPPVMRPMPAQVGAARAAADQIFAAIDAVRGRPSAPAGERVEAVRKAAGVPLSDAAAWAGATAAKPAFAAARQAAVNAVDGALAEGVSADDLPMARERVRGMVRRSSLAPGLAALASEVGVAVVRPTLEVDQARTAERRQSAADLVPPVRTRVQRGQSILRKGDVITPSHMAMLSAVGVYPPRVTWAAVGGVAAVVALLLFVTAVYLWQVQPEIWTSDRSLVLWGVVVVGTVFIGQAVDAPRFSSYLMPAAAGSMLIGILLGSRLAMFSSAVLALLVGLAAGRLFAPVVVAFAGGLIGVFATRQIHRRWDLLLAGLLVGLTSAGATVAAGLVEGLALREMPGRAAWAVGNGLLSGVIAIGVLPFLEQLFGLVTPIKLLELANPAHPLLRRLQLEAPGTYHHSIMVGNLAEAAAEAIGADALLVRVGTYYHDIGKLRRPAFFIENQVGIDNPHDKMTPSLSALTVAAHVRDGLDLARASGLPEAVAAFIPQHHGTALMPYFYHQAMERGDALDEGAFRYEGPKPQTRETAIVMLADAVEAAARSLTRPTPDRLDEVVRRLIREKLEDGQLDECPLTFRDLDRIAAAFVRILTGILHPRIEYPDLEREITRRRRDRVARVR
jgi:putative nucleotidyltransferase with HDIG domain